MMVLAWAMEIAWCVWACGRVDQGVAMSTILFTWNLTLPLVHVSL